MRTIIALISLSLSVQLIAINSEGEKLTQIKSALVAEYPSLNVPEIKLSLQETFEAIQDLAGIKNQTAFFNRYSRRLSEIETSNLSFDGEIQYQTLKWAVDLNLQRLRLERRFKKEYGNGPFPADIFHISNRRQWYRYYIAKWTSSRNAPHRLFSFGQHEIKRVRAKIHALQIDLGCEHLKSEKFIQKDEVALQKALFSTRETIYRNIGNVFNETNIPLIDIKPIEDSDKDTPPGYYKDGVFYYGFFENRFPLRSLEWLFIHEAVPGHHYQGSVAPKNSNADLFWFPGFSEGWAAYAENLGTELGVYTDAYQQLGKWEWDLVRSARVSMDVGINYYGWTNQQALAFWQANIPCQEGISVREVDRMRRWPAQVLSYKVGEHEFLQGRSKASDLKTFHSSVLKRGTVPLPVLRRIIRRS